MLLRRDRPRALAVADAVMTAAERLGLDDVVADTFITKGVLVSQAGRGRESIALMSAGINVARQIGEPTIALRGCVNLSHVLEPLEGLEVERDGYVEARRLGLASQAMLLLGNAVAYAVDTGEWAWAADAAHEALLGATDRLGVLCSLVWVDGLRGLPIDAYVAEIEAWGGGSDLAVAAADLADSRLAQTLSQPDMAAAFDIAYEMEVDELAGAGYGLLWAARTASLLGERERLERVVPLLARHGPGSRLLLASRHQVEASLAALDGDEGGSLAGWREARRLYQDLGCRPALALCDVAMGSLLPHSEPAVRAALDRPAPSWWSCRRPWLALLDAIDAPGGGIAGEGPPSDVGGRVSASTAQGHP
ncbi:MAG: hypothetical protein R3C32_10770 [Chloroflexota bacterium]